MRNYKWCIVPNCTSTSIKTPEKLFVSVPKESKRRKQWLELARRDLKSLGENSAVFMCEDHFEIEKDVANYMQYKMGFSQHILLKHGVMPTKFDCQQNCKTRQCGARKKKLYDANKGRLDDTGHLMESGSNNMINSKIQKMDIKIKEETVCPNGTFIQVKSEYEEVNDFHSKFFITSDFVKDYSRDSEICNTIEIKEEPIWCENTPNEIKEEMEVTSAEDANLKNNIGEPALDTEVITGDAAAEAAYRFHIDPSYRYSDNASCMFTNTNSQDNCLRKNNTGIITRLPEIIKDAADFMLESHLKTSLMHKCETCNQNFDRLSKLNNHKLMHEGKGHFNCNMCKKGNFQASNFKKHELTPKTKTLHQYEICNKSFSKTSNLKRHKLFHEYRGPHHCQICSKSFIGVRELKQHKLIHKGKRLHICDLCNKSFAKKSHLKEHKLIHENKRPHICEICSKSFTKVSNLKLHKLIHDGKRPHICEICNKSFTQKCNLKEHKWIHERKRAYICEICSKSFTTVSNLKQHKLMHDGKRPHICDICNKSFTQKSHLREHEFIHKVDDHTYAKFVPRALLGHHR